MNQKKYGILLSYASIIVTILTGLLYTPVMLRLLGQNEYGIYQLANSLVTYLSLLNLGLNGSYIKFYMREKVKGDKEGVAGVNGMFLLLFSAISIFAVIGGTILVCNVRLVGNSYTEEEIGLIRYLMIFMIINMASSFPNALFLAYMSACEDFIFQRVITLASNILIPIVNIPLLYFGYGSKGMVTFATALAIVRFAINIWYCFARLGIQFRFRGLQKNLLKELAGFTFFIFLSDLADQLNQNVDRFLLSRILGAVSVAIYSVAHSIKNYFTEISWAIPTVYIPQVNKMAEKGDRIGTNSVFTETGRMSNAVLAPVIIGFILFGRKFIYLWAGADYSESYYVTVILLVAGYIPAVQSIGVNIQNAMNMHRTRSIVYFLASMGNVLLSIQLIPRYGVTGTALGTLIAILMCNGLFMNIYYQRKIGLDIIEFWKQIVSMLLPMLPAVICGVLLNKFLPMQRWSVLFVQLLIFAIVYGVFMWFFGLNETEKEIGRKALRKVMRKSTLL